ncbi:MAG: hypothetical protein AAB655_00580 [Patescibacteria group bacterium]
MAYDYGKIISVAMDISSWALLAFFVIATIILNYHWKKYEVDTMRVRATRYVYFTVSAVLITVSAILFYYASL